jgi:hypothetical protein
MLTESFVGGTLSAGSAVTVRPRNSYQPHPEIPAASAFEGRTVDVAGTPSSQSAGPHAGVSTAIVPPGAEYYIQFTQLGGGQPPTDIEFTLNIAIIEPYPLR